MRQGIEDRRIRLRISPGGRGSGEQFVRRRYAEELLGYRERRYRIYTALLVLIDADQYGVEERLQHLRNAASAFNVDDRFAGERIAVFVPKRTVETWIRCLLGREVDEVADYSDDRELCGRQTKPAALVLFDWARRQESLPVHCPDSLRRAIRDEIPRIAV